MPGCIALTLERAIHIDGYGRQTAVVQNPKTEHALHMLRVAYEADMLGRAMFSLTEVGEMVRRFDETGVRQ